jgi:hypothetical protein
MFHSICVQRHASPGVTAIVIGTAFDSLVGVLRPSPSRDLRIVDAMFVGVTATRNLRVAESFFSVPADRLQPGHAVNSINRQTETISLVFNSQFHGCVDVAFLFVPAHMQSFVLSAVSQAMDQPRIPVEVKNDRFIAGKQRVEVRLGQPVRMLSAGLQLEEVNHVDKTNLDIREFLAQQGDCRQRLLCWYVPGARHNQVGLATLVVAGPIPNTDALGTVRDRRIYVEVLQMELFVRNNRQPYKRRGSAWELPQAIGET